MGSLVAALRSARPVFVRTVFSSLIACLTACGGGDEETPARSAASPAAHVASLAPAAAASSAPLSIVGTPSTSIRRGLNYNFEPAVPNAGSRQLTFQIANKPRWASFSPYDGSLHGAPGPADLGNYPDIVISVGDGQQIVSLPRFAIDVVATASGSIVVSWNPPVARTDGSPLRDLAGFKIYFGTRPGEYAQSVTIANSGLTTYMIEELTPATYFVVATSFDSSGVESQFSNVASKRVF